MPRALLLALLAAACGADAPDDPLDPDVVDDVAKDGGDAEGSARSGAYALQPAGAQTCDCPEVQGIDLCKVDLTSLGSAAVVTLEQTDGYLLLVPSDAPGTLTLTGPLAADGAFDLAGIYDITSVLGEGDLYSRLTGAFADADTFTATLRTRIDGDISGTAVDCRTEVDVTGARLPDPA